MMLSAIQEGLLNVLVWPNILIPVLATLIMMTTSFLPGIGGLGIATFLMILTLSWDPISVLLLFGAVVGGATFMGSVTAILFKVPGSAPSAASLIDGFPLGQKGYPRTAIACSATASAVGSLIGVVALISIIPFIRPILLEVGPFERLVLGIWGLTTIISIPSQFPMRSLAMSLLGFLIAMIGSDPETGLARWTFSSIHLYTGLSSVVILLGLFTISEILSWRPVKDLHGSEFHPAPDDGIGKGIASIFQNFGLTLNSSLIGTMVGIIPGIGGTVASFIAYGRAAKKYDPEDRTFGKGDIRGLIAPEAAVDAKDGGSLLPVIAFGLAGSEGTVILLAVLNIHGITPGLPMLTTDLALTFTLIFSLLFSNLFTSIVGVAAVPALSRLKTIRIDRLALPAFLATIWAALELNGNIHDVYMVMLFGVSGFVLVKAKWPIIPFVLAFILSRFIETNLSLTTRLIEIDRLTILDRPISLIFLIVLVGSALWGYTRRKRRKESQPISILNLFVSLALLLISVLFLYTAFYSGSGYSHFAKYVALATTLIMMINLYRETVVYRAKAESKILSILTSKIPPFDRALVKHLLLLPLFALTAYGFGLAIAIGILIFGWQFNGIAHGYRNLLTSIAVAISITTAFQFYITHYSAMVLNKPAILDVIGLLTN